MAIIISNCICHYFLSIGMSRLFSIPFELLWQSILVDCLELDDVVRLETTSKETKKNLEVNIQSEYNRI